MDPVLEIDNDLLNQMMRQHSNEVVLLREGNESVRRDVTVKRVLPSGEHFNTRHPPRLAVVKRLINRHDLVLSNGVN